DSYRLDVGAMPEFPASAAGADGAAGGAAGASGGADASAAAPRIRSMKIADGVWDVRVVDGSGGAVIEFADHLVMFEPYGNETQTFARIDAANRLVPGKQVTAVIVSHHHDDHAG